MLIYVSADSFEEAQAKAAGVALGTGWMLVRLEKGMEVKSVEFVQAGSEIYKAS
mgnify:CR=1 FL=1